MRAASRRDLVPGTGLTPREQVSHLAISDQQWRDEYARLGELVERCLYRRAGSHAEIEEGLELCRLLRSGLPPLPPMTVRSLWRIWEERLAPYARWVVGLILVGGMVAIVLNVKPGGVWSTNVNAEWSSMRAAQRDRKGTSWETAPPDVTWQRRWIDPVLDAGTLEYGRCAGFDLDTGVDGEYYGADDPFSPPLYWTHRLHVFTGISSTYGFGAAGAPYREGSGEAMPGSRRFDVEVEVNLEQDRRVPAPSSSPDAVVVSYDVSPSQAIRFEKDVGDGLYVIGARSGVARLRYQLASGPGYREASLPDTPFSPGGVALPANVMRDAAQVIEAIGELPQATYSGTVGRLHRYFASFTVGPIANRAGYHNDFLAVALSRRGVCRHRARAFFVVANAVGVDTRLVENRTHSFCEVRLPDGSWRRMEFRLGDEEGPPVGSLNAGNYRVGYLAFWWSSIVLVLALCALLRRGFDLRGTADVQPVRDDAMAQRVRRAVKQDVLAAEAGRLAVAVQQRAASALGAKTATPAAIAAAADAAHLPPLARARLRTVLEFPTASDDARIETRQIERVFWSCFYLLRWFDRSES